MLMSHVTPGQQGKVCIATCERNSDCTFVTFLIKQVKMVTNYLAERPEMSSVMVLYTYRLIVPQAPYVLFSQNQSLPDYGLV